MIKSASGAYEKIKMIEVLNLNRAVEFLKKNGFWIIGLDSKSKENIKNLPKNTKKVLVLGSEDRGIRKLVKKNCDYTIKIETVITDNTIVDSLNVSNACAIILNQLINNYERNTKLL